jgi:hypothetical protein
MAATGFLPGVLSSLCALSHLEESLTGQQATRSPVLRGHNNPRGKQTQAFPKPVQQSQDDLTVFIFRIFLRSNFPQGNYTDSPHPRQNGSFPIRPTQDRLTLGCRECVTDNPRKGQCRSRTVSEDVRGFFCKSQTLPFWQSLSPLEEEPPTRLISAFYCMARVDTCHPCNCTRSCNVRAFHRLEITCPTNKDLGYNI